MISCETIVSKKINSLWTPEKTVKSPFRDLEIPDTTIPEHIWKNLEKWADKTALVCGISDRHYTYQQVHKYSRNFAVNLRIKLEIRDGDVLCIMMPNLPEYGIAALGILQAGGILTTMNPIYTTHEVYKQLQLSQPKVVIGIPQTINVLKEAMKMANMEINIITVDAKDDLCENTFEELALENVDDKVLIEVKIKSDDIAFLPYSSGTTGLSKGVELTHRNIVSNMMQLDVDEIKHYGETTSSSQDSVMAVLPFFHIYGLMPVMMHKLSVGLKIVTIPKFQPDTFLNAMIKYSINVLLSAPPLILFLATHKDVTKKHLENLKFLTSGAAPLAVHDIHRVLNLCPPTTKFVQLYGLTETSPIATSTTLGSIDYSTSGFAVSNTELRIVDSDLRNLGPNEVGELLIRGPHIMKGYKNNPEATKAAITEDGWFRTGDLAKIDEHGVLTIADRLKELIKVKAYPVPPAELENVLKEHPSIQDAAVIGIPDEKQGEVPKAFVVVKEGEKINANDVLAFVSERVAVYKRIKEVEFVEAIPKNPTGKILRRVLKNQCNTSNTASN